MAQYDDLPIKRITVVGLLSIAITFITVLGVQVLYFGMQGYVDEAKLASSTYADSIAALESQSAKLERYSVDEQTGNITVPIKDAIQKVLATSAQNAGETGEKSAADQPTGDT